MNHLSPEQQKSAVLEQNIQKFKNVEQAPLTEQELVKMVVDLEQQSEQESEQVLGHGASVLDQGLESLGETGSETQKTSISLKDKFIEKVSTLKNSFVSKLKMVGVGAALIGSTSLEGITQNVQGGVSDNIEKVQTKKESDIENSDEYLKLKEHFDRYAKEEIAEVPDNLGYKAVTSIPRYLPQKNWAHFSPYEALAPTKYTGIEEAYTKAVDSEDGLYSFAGYQDAEGNPISFPEEIQNQILIAEQNFSKLSNIDQEVIDRMNYQKSPQFVEDMINAEKPKYHKEIAQASMLIINYQKELTKGVEDNEVLKKKIEYEQQRRKFAETILDKLEHDEVFRNKIIQERTLSEGEARSITEADLSRTVANLQDLKEKLKSVQEYIRQHKNPEEGTSSVREEQGTGIGAGNFYSAIVPQTRFITNPIGGRIPYLEKNYYEKGTGKLIRTEKIDPVTKEPLQFEGIGNFYRKQREEYTNLEASKKFYNDDAQELLDAHRKYYEEALKGGNPEDIAFWKKSLDESTQWKEGADGWATQLHNQFMGDFKTLDAEKEWLNQNINSPEYKRRLVAYEKMDPKEQYERLKRLNDTDLDFKMGVGAGRVIISKDSATGETKAKMEIYPNYKNEFNSEFDSQGLMVHEGTHLSTYGEEKISDYAKNLYREAFNKEGLTISEINHQKLGAAMNGNFDSDGSEYLNDPTELDARKKQTEFFLEQQGIKKYDEKFTEKHYLILKNLEQEKKLPQNVEEFIRLIKPEYIEKIMNTIAMNEDKSNNNLDHAQG